MKEVNSLINSAISDKTYYFSYAAGIRNVNKTKQREILKEPKRVSRMTTGFDIDVFDNMQFTE